MRTVFVTLSLFLIFPLVAATAPVRARSVVPKTVVTNHPAKSDWSGSVSLGGFRGSDEFSSPVYSGDFGLGYAIDAQQSFGLQLGYWQPSEADSDRMYHYGFRDTELNYSFKKMAEFTSGISMDGGVGLSLPTSEVSNRATLLGSLAPSLQVTYPIYGKVLEARSQHAIGYSWYRYDAPSSVSLNYNTPWMINNGVGLSAKAGRFALGVGYQFTRLIDFAGTHIDVQTLSSSLGLTCTENINLSLYARWKDRTVSDNSLFDSDTRTVGLSMVLSL